MRLKGIFHSLRSFNYRLWAAGALVSNVGTWMQRIGQDWLVLTQDGRVWRRLTEDGDEIEQEYIVEVSGDIGPWGLKRLCHGLHYNGRALPPCKVSWQNEIRLRFALKGVQGGQLRDMCAQVGLEVVAIRRIRIGKVPLAKMPVGMWRYLPVGERF